ncbi:hypothetical protein ACPCVO_48770 [Streptomyces umbrinus]
MCTAHADGAITPSRRGIPLVTQRHPKALRGVYAGARSATAAGTGE